MSSPAELDPGRWSDIADRLADDADEMPWPVTARKMRAAADSIRRQLQIERSGIHRRILRGTGTSDRRPEDG